MSNLVPNVCSNPAGCQCAICKLYPTPEPEPRGGMLPMPTSQSWVEYDLAVARRVRAADKLRAQRKRHAQRLAALQAKLDEAEAKLQEAMEIVMHVASGRAGSFGMIDFDHEIYLKARALVQYTVPRETAPRKENKA